MVKDYCGYRIFKENEVGSMGYSGRLKLEDELAVNEYAIVQNKKGEAIDYFRWEKKKLIRVPFPIIDNSFSVKIKPRNQEQYCAMDMLKRDDKPVKILSGTHGAGKDLLMVNTALEKINKGQFKSIFYVRNNIEVKDTVPLGALPGEKDQKLKPFLAALADHVGSWTGFYNLVEAGLLDGEHLGYLRGRDLKNSIILVSEAENLTTKHIQLLLGRVGEDSELWINGDHRQTDKAVFEKDSGMRLLIEKLKDHKLVGYIHLPRTERSSVARLADLLDQ